MNTNQTLQSHLAVIRLHNFKARVRAPRNLPTAGDPLLGIMRQLLTHAQLAQKSQQALAQEMSRLNSLHNSRQLGYLSRSAQAAETLAQVMSDIRSVVPGLGEVPQDEDFGMDSSSASEFPPITPS